MGFLVLVFTVFNLNFWIGVAVLVYLEKQYRLPVWFGVKDYVNGAIFWPVVYSKFS